MEWSLEGINAAAGPSKPADRFFGWRDRKEWVPTRAIQAVADEGVELHTGELRGRRGLSGPVEVTLRAKRQEGWEVETKDAKIAEAVKATFPGATALASGGVKVPPGPRTFIPGRR